MARLTALQIAKLTAKGRYPDGNGLFLTIGPSGAKSWLLRFQLNGRERYMGLGSVKNFTLKEARERARKARQLLDDGIDPIERSAWMRRLRELSMSDPRYCQQETRARCPLSARSRHQLALDR